MQSHPIRTPPSKKNIQLSCLLIALGLFVLIAATYLLRPQILEDIEGRLLDARFKLRGPIEGSGLVSLVTVDERSLERFGRWPWSRERIAQLIEALSVQGAAVIGLDIVFAEPQANPLAEQLGQLQALGDAERTRLAQLLEDRDPDRLLAAGIEHSARVIGGYFFYTSAQSAQGLRPIPPEQEQELLARSGVDALRSRSDKFPAREALARRGNIPLIASAAQGAGFFNFIPGRDGIIRNAPLLMRYQGEFYPSLALKTLAFYLDRASIVVHAEDYGIDHISLGGYAIPTNEVGELLLNYRGPAGTLERISAADILEGRLEPGRLEGKLVLLGVTAIGVYDAHSTPYGPSFPGLEIQGNVAENIIQGDFIHHTGMELLIDLLAVFTVLLLLALMLPRFSGIVYRFALTLAVLALYIWLNLYWFAAHQLWLNLTYPLLAWVLGYISLNLYLALVVERRYATVHTAFKYYLQPELVDRLTQDPELLQFGGAQKHLTILFSDIRNFTNLSEGLTPLQLAKFINCYMDPMTEEVLKHRGTLDKYIGDAVMAIFGAPIPVPEHARDACQSALAMIADLDHIETCCPELAHIFPIRIGIGIHSGDVVVGNLGSSFHFTYTALGDNVNLASRLEGLTKVYGVNILVSEATRGEVGAQFAFRELDRVRVKGKQVPIRIFELLGSQATLEPGQTQALAQWHEALAHYHAQAWESALSGFERLQAHEPFAKSCGLYIERCQHYRQSPPATDWDGVTTFTQK